MLRGINSNSIDLIYLDPPFNKKKIFAASAGSAAEGAAFSDIFREEDVKDEWVDIITETNESLGHYIEGVSKIGHRSNKYYLCYMAIRLIEMHRILKDTGSIYLHCDSTMSHYLKLLLDCVFGEQNFRNEIVWCYNRFSRRGHHAFPSMNDTLLFYAKTNNNTFSKIQTSARDQKRYKKGYHVVVDKGVKKLLIYNEKLALKNKVDFSKYEKVAHTKARSPILGNVFSDIPIINPRANERLGYPTQKPLALLKRIIQASSNKGDIVLDPFCGCATTCVAAEQLERQWIGIDVSKKAFELVKERLNKDMDAREGMYAHTLIDRDDIPTRTDLSKTNLSKTEIKTKLYGEQKGECNGCKVHFEYRNFHMDHIVPRIKGGGNDVENLQLLCGNCNSVKGDRDMSYLLSKRGN